MERRLFGAIFRRAWSKAGESFIIWHSGETTLGVLFSSKGKLFIVKPRIGKKRLTNRLGRFGDVGDWAGGDLIADWFRRNIRIYSNIMKLVDSPDERVLVIYGAGHLGWLEQDFASNPEIKLRKLAEFAR